MFLAGLHQTKNLKQDDVEIEFGNSSLFYSLFAYSISHFALRISLPIPKVHYFLSELRLSHSLQRFMSFQNGNGVFSLHCAGCDRMI